MQEQERRMTRRRTKAGPGADAKPGMVQGLVNPFAQEPCIVIARRILMTSGKYPAVIGFRGCLVFGHPRLVYRYFLREVGDDRFSWYPILLTGESHHERTVIRTGGYFADDMPGGAAHKCRREVAKGDFQ